MAVTPYLFREATPLELEAVINPVLATLLAVRVIGTEVDAVQITPAYTKNVFVAFTTDTVDANVITSPYVFKTFAAAEDVGARQLALNFMTANPTYFFSPIFAVYRPAVTDPNQSTVVGVFYNADAAEGYSNWGYAGSGGGGGAPTGPAGGDLAGTYPNPTLAETTHGEGQTNALAVGANVVWTEPLATAGGALVHLLLQKAATQYRTTISINQGDGVTPNWEEENISINPAVGGTFDFTVAAVISGADLQVVVTPASTGWNARTFAQVLAPGP